jgi:hypothetical protein
MNRLVPWLMMLTLGAGLCAQPQASNWLLGPGIVTSPVYEEKRLMLSFREDTVSVVELPNPEPEWNVFEPVSSISDQFGDLLYYSNNIITYNRNHEVLFGSEDVNAAGGPGTSSTITNGVLLLPLPGDSIDRYHVLLTHKVDQTSPDYHKFQWSLIDGAADGGLGSVVDSIKARNVWDFKVQEKLAVVKHANGRDWWLVARKGIEADTISYRIRSISFAFALLTPQGITNYGEQITPVTSEGQWGEMVFSKDGTKLAEVCMPYAESQPDIQFVSLYKFDRCTGALTWLDSLSAAATGANGFYSVAFDESAKKLYAGPTDGHLRVYQFSVADNVIDSFYEVFRFGPGYHDTGQFELGPDGKIYVVFRPWVSVHPLKQHLGVIRNPSAYGSACAFDTFGVTLGVNMQTLGLPPQPNYALGALEGSGCDTLGSTSSAEGPAPPVPWTLYPNPASDRAWLEGLPEGSSWVLMDVLGRPLRSGFARHGRITLDLEGIGQGPHLVLVHQPGGSTAARRLMVARP